MPFFCLATLRYYTLKLPRSILIASDEEKSRVDAALLSKHELSICALMDGRTPMSLWIDNIGEIFNASQHPKDASFAWHDATAEVLKLISPRLVLGPRNLPRDWKAISALMRKAEKRFAYLRDQQAGIIQPAARTDDIPPPPIKIVVYGGSVTMGHACEGGKGFTTQDCAWPARLSHLINALAGGELVQVHNLGQAATTTRISQAIIEYNLLPLYAQSPDIIINNHAPNDHALVLDERINKTRWEAMFDNTQEFARTVLKTKTCTTEGTPPLLLWVDDYLGNKVREILKTTELAQGVQVLANYYGFGFASYADMVRDLVYSDIRETTLSPHWFINDSRQMTLQVHYGTTVHIAISYMIAFYLLQVASNYCSIDGLDPELIDVSTGRYNVSKAPGLPTLRGQLKRNIPPRSRLAGLPPRLDSQLQLERITELWTRASQTQLSAKENRCSSVSITPQRCPFFWLNNIPYGVPPAQVTEHFKPFMLRSRGGGWKIGANPTLDKHGFVPDRIGATMTLKFDLEQEINHVLIFYMKSYGPRWENSTMQVLVKNEESIVQSCSLSGSHGKNVSETYVEVLTLPEPQKHIRVVLKHISGKVSKMMGFAVCN